MCGVDEVDGRVVVLTVRRLGPQPGWRAGRCAGARHAVDACDGDLSAALDLGGAALKSMVGFWSGL